MNTSNSASSAGKADELPRSSADDIDQWLAELSKSPSVLQRREIAERIAAAVSRFVMIDEEILSPALMHGLDNWRRHDGKSTSPIFYL